jgi:ACS family hexuronate transporter-like MFS transporter
MPDRLAVRWLPTFSMMLVSLISYIDRTTLALLSPAILRETGLNAEQYGYIVLAFSVAYTIFNPVWGWVLDRTGLRRGMMAAVAWWTAASAAHAFAAGFWSFGVARAALGIGEGATFPGALRAVAQTLPAEQRGRGMAVSYSGGSLGAAITPVIVTPIYLLWGWRGAFWFTGAIGAAWLALWMFVGSSPSLDRTLVVVPQHPGPQWRDREFWALLIAYAFGAITTGFVIYSAPLYLARALNCSQEFIGKVLWIPPLGWEAGYFFWGWLADRGLRRGEARFLTIRRLLTWSFLASLPFVSIPWLPSVGAVMAEMFLAMFAASGFIVLSVIYAAHVYSADHSGMIAGTSAGAWSLVVGISMPLFGRLFDRRSFTAPYIIATAIIVLGYAGWILLHSLKPPKPKPDKVRPIRSWRRPPGLPSR